MATARRRNPVEPPAKRPKFEESHDNGPSADEFIVTPMMKADMREELASLLHQPPVEDEVADVEAEMCGSEEEDGEQSEAEKGATIAQIDTPSASEGLRAGATEIKEKKTEAHHERELSEEALDEDYVPEKDMLNPASVPANVPPAMDENEEKNKVRQKKRAFFNPRMWPEGRQDAQFLTAATKLAETEEKIRCHETGVELDLNETNVLGSLWQEMRKHELFDMREGGGASMDQREVLKACVRLGRMMDPEKLSILLGGKSRSPEYCRFILSAFLGLLNVRKTRKILRGDQKSGNNERHREVLVYADQLYSSNDELLNSLERKTKESDDQTGTRESGAVNPTWKLKDSPPDEDEFDMENEDLPFQHLQFDCGDDEEFANTLSHVLRTYLSNIVARPVRRLGEFFLQCDALGMTFEAAAGSVLSRRVRAKGLKVKPAENRLKWLTEPMPAPEIGENKSAKLGTIDLWRHASKYFSVQQLSRMALVQHDRVIDWLCLVAIESKIPKSDAEYNRDHNLVVSIAPIPLLYLADYAVKFALKVLGVAVHVAENMSMEGDNTGDSQRVITADDIRYAAGWVMGVAEKHRVAYDLYSSSSAGSVGMMTPGSWPNLIQRPLSPSEDFTVCNRVPVNKFAVPVNAVHEAKAVLDSFKDPVRRRLYTNLNSIEMKDPRRFMAREDKERVRLERVAWRKKHGITAFIGRKSGAGKVDVKTTEVDEIQVTVTAPENESMGTIVGEVDEEDHVEETAVNSDDEAENNNDPTWTTEMHGSPKDMVTQECSTSQAISKLLGIEVDVDDEFLSDVNAAERACQRIGLEKLQKRKEAAHKLHAREEEEMKGVNRDNLKEFLKLSKNWHTIPPCGISYHRLAWICLRALGDDVSVDSTDENHLLGYGSTANYTNFGEFGTSDKVTVDTSGFDCLIQLVDQHLRMEAEILMECAVHDDGRPWIDRADVVLVTGLRKQEYRYGTIGL